MKTFTRLLTLLLMVLLMTANFVSAQQILCVDRDGSFEAVGVYTDDWQFIQPALDELGFEYDYFEVQDLTQDGPDEATMADYPIVFWFTGEAWTGNETMTDNDEFNLMLYLLLDNGKLILSAQDYLYDRYQNATTFAPGTFPYDVLGLIEVNQDVWSIEPDTGNVVGVAGSLADGMAFTIKDIYTEETDDGLYIDEFVEHKGNDMLEVQFPEPSGIGAYQYDAGTHKVIFSAISYAAIVDLEHRKGLLNNSINWMNGTLGVSTPKTEKTEILVYPNPATKSTQIGCKYTIEELWVINSTGQLVDHFNVNNKKALINTSSYCKGIYLVKLKTDNGIVTSRLLVE